MIRQKEFPQKTFNRKSTCFFNEMNSVTTLLLSHSSFFLFAFWFSHSGGPLKKIGYKLVSHCCVVRENEFFKKVEMSKIKYFTGMDLTIKAFVLNQSSF